MHAVPICRCQRPWRLSLIGGVIAVMLAQSIAALADETVTLIPQRISLVGSTARIPVLVERIKHGLASGQITSGIVFRSSDEKIVRIENGVAVPVADGKANISAKAGDGFASALVEVSGMERPAWPGFRNDVQPVLTRAGCNSGACHGAAAGKNGFRLSLRGYDDSGDYQALTRQFLGRRIDLGDPGHSLMLLKPTMAVPHKGGERFKVDSDEYRLLSEWIANGAPGPKADDPHIERIELLPEHVIQKPGDTQQLLVLAHFSDGSVRDVTHWSKFTSTDSTVGAINEEGIFNTSGHGEGAVTAWYLSKIAIATITSPFENSVDPAQYAGARNVIDEKVNAKLLDLKLAPSPRADDSEWIRRAFIDTIGVLPTAEETREFLADASADKRDRLIDALLARPEFVDYWTYRWSDLLLVSSHRLKPPQMWAYYRWIREQVAANIPWDEFARRLVTATGSVQENGAGNFYVLHDDPSDISETLCVTMLGMSINCAKCHNHPMEKWTNDQYYGMANLFARVRAKSGPDGLAVIFNAADGDVIQPLTGKPQPPRPLDAASAASESDRRAVFADWLTRADNPYFARAIVNRIWANFMGIGLVEKVDDMRMTNPASNESLLSALAGYLRDQHYDLKLLMRLILQSQTYQRSSHPLPGSVADTKFFSRHYPRRMSAEVLLDAISQVTHTPTPFPKYPTGWRALQLPDSNIDSYFLKSFGRPERVLSCECERTGEPSMAQAMHIANGDTINQKLESAGNVIDQLLAAHTPDERMVEEAYLSAFSRLPSTSEKEQILSLLKSGGDADRRKSLEDLYWGLLSSNNFLFDH